jgi:hypothetical protein
MFYTKEFPETRVRRKIQIRIDCIGIYLLAFGLVDDLWSDEPNMKTESLVAGVSYQWPRWLAYLVGDKHAYEPYNALTRNYFSIYNYE